MLYYSKYLCHLRGVSLVSVGRETAWTADGSTTLSPAPPDILADWCNVPGWWYSPPVDNSGVWSQQDRKFSLLNNEANNYSSQSTYLNQVTALPTMQLSIQLNSASATHLLLCFSSTRLNFHTDANEFSKK